MNHERFDELKDAFALGALPEEERREVEEYLAAHPERQAEIDKLGAVAGLMALAPQQHEPPPELRKNIMSVVEAEARPQAESEPRFGGLRELFGIRNLALGVAALLVIGLFSWNVLLRGEVQDLEGQVASQQQTLERQMIALEGTGAAQQASVEVMILEDQNHAVLIAEDLPSVPEDSTYQIWVIEGDVPRPNGLLESREGSTAAMLDDLPEQGDTIAITVEPAGGSPQPTTDPLLAGKV
jgi:anti-sigma-K factor RskA